MRTRLRDRLLRALQIFIGLLVRAVYRVRASGLRHLPKEGAALVVANHVTYADALILGGLCPRPVRFVIDHRIHDAWPLRWFFRLTRAIPIAPRHEDPERLAEALDEIDRALVKGELVGIFPEGRLTRDGALCRFKSGVERIVERRPVPVVPVALKGLWGSVFSYAGGKPLAKWPRRFWTRIEVEVERAFMPDAVSATGLQQTIGTMLTSPPQGPRV